MKKILILAAFAVISTTSLFAASYTNNKYQKLAREYTQKAQKALDAGHYDLAEEYAAEAEKNAELSDAFIKNMLSRAKAEETLAKAKKKLDYAESVQAELNFPLAYKAAQEYYAQAQEAFSAEEWENAEAFAMQVLDALADVREVTPLPKFYIVRPWALTKDCFWNISGRPYVYNNPFLWENLYEANKGNIPQRNNPNLILPGMKMEIPSISGEYRDGVYSPDADYEAFNANR